MRTENYTPLRKSGSYRIWHTRAGKFVYSTTVVGLGSPERAALP